ncbi:uncharacterized protein RCC_03510 [Ramularia collo-cygni]|uniref:Uncharacterized protein n=1 Tax=Ramularia collo-cygni TaxID=112498 RepID=A0A2D3VB31_9PEZI|nr:uncharacterized protein RCC_03510 [Ramularia collo-cygni]CZT17673.1 uncharacterized protein RCC_03510 [Ramularia collo-cygni]
MQAAISDRNTSQNLFDLHGNGIVYVPHSADHEAFVPEFEYAAEVLASPDIYLTSYDCTVIYDESFDFCGSMLGSTEPAMFLLYQGHTSSPTVYDGPRQTAKDIISYMTKEKRAVSSSSSSSSSSPSSSSSTQVRTKPSKTPLPKPSPNSTAGNAVWLAGNGSRALASWLFLDYWIPQLLRYFEQGGEAHRTTGKRPKDVTFVRHRLQNLLHPPSRIAPSDEDMTVVANFIVKEPNVSGDFEHGFKKRCSTKVSEKTLPSSVEKRHTILRLTIPL